MYLPSPAAVSTYISTFSTSTSYSQYHNIHNLNSEVRSAQPRGLSDSNSRSDAPPFCSIVVDNASGKEVKEVKVVLYQELKYHGVYKPPKPKPKKKLNPGKARKARMAEKRNARKPGFRKKNTIKPLRPERPARPPGEIKKTKVRP